MAIADSVSILTEEFEKDKASPTEYFRGLVFMTENLAAVQVSSNSYMPDADKRATAEKFATFRAKIDYLSRS